MQKTQNRQSTEVVCSESSAQNCLSKVIQKLIERFDSKPKSQWDESQIRTSLLNPFWRALGWEIDDPNQVEVEKRVNMKDHLRRADYAFLDAGKVIFMVEAKSPAKKLLSDRDAIFQLKRYVFNTPGTNIGILQDFEEFVPYIVFHKPNYKLPQDGLLREYVMDYKQYLERIDELIEIFSHKAVLSGSLERFIPKGRKIEKIAEPVNRAFFKDLMKWRLGIAKSIAKNNPHVSDDEINEAVNHLLNRILFLRVIEDRKIEPNEILYAEWVKWQREERGPLYAYLLELFKRNEPKYNGALFARHLCDKLIIDDKPLHDLIRNLYYPNSSYQFSVLPVEIIGNAYEQYLGSIIRLTPARRVKLEEKPEVRKAGGVYYTPKYIVDYIVEQTVGKLVEGKKPSQVRQLKILDPACGSGSFLIGAYERIVKYYIDYYTAHPNENKGFLIGTREDNKKISLTLKKQILEDNIYGVDIDPRAIDITQFSLYVKMMQDEEFRGLFGAAILPDLRDNIKCGNSLIRWDILEMGILPEGEERDEILKRINPFDWEDAFPMIMKQGGFDAVIGNPPYGAELFDTEYLIEHYPYSSKMKEINTYLYFIEQGNKLLKKMGMFSFIIPDTILTKYQYANFRDFLYENVTIESIMETGTIFEQAKATPNIVLVFSRQKPSKNSKIKRLIVDYNMSINDILNDVAKRNFKETGFLSYDVWGRSYLLSFGKYIDEKKLKTIDKILSNSQPLKEIENIKIDRGLEGGKSSLKEKGRYEILVPLNIDKYRINDLAKYIDNYKDSFNRDRILVIRIRNLKIPTRIIASFENRKRATLKTLQQIFFEKKSLYSLKYILGILNSKLLNFYCNHFLIDDINKKYLNQLPIRTIDFSNPDDVKQHDRMVSLVEEMLELHKRLTNATDEKTKAVIQKQIEITDKKIDALVYILYRLTEEEIKIVEKES